MSSATAQLFANLEQKRKSAQGEFEKRHRFANIWLREHGLEFSQIRIHSQKLLAGATLGSALLLVSPKLSFIANNSQSVVTTPDKQLSDFLHRLNQFTAPQLNVTTETEFSLEIKNFYAVSTAFELDHNRLPAYSGLMGLEQHLVRFSGDTISQHDGFQEAGLASGKGAFGYFSEPGKSEAEVKQQEKYYIVLQTFLIPQWNQEWSTLKDWYKFRKFLVINPENGKAVVAVLGDSGPGVSTGKQFGGSPEVMAELGFYPQRTKGKTIIIFLDDPGNDVPLGPVVAKEGTL